VHLITFIVFLLNLNPVFLGPRASASAIHLESAGISNDSGMFDFQDLLAQPEIEGMVYPIVNRMYAESRFLAFHPLPDASPPTNVADDDIFKTEYHHNSRRGVKVTRASHRRDDSAIRDPWWPCFNTHADYVLSQLLSEGHVSRELSDKFIKFIRSCVAGKEELTVTGVADIDAAWQRASSMLTPVSSSVVRA
jgi:hypothetical protein